MMDNRFSKREQEIIVLLLQGNSKNKILWLLIALMVLIASLIGVANQGIYQKFRVTAALPAILSQDMIAVLASIAMLYLIIRMNQTTVRVHRLSAQTERGGRIASSFNILRTSNL